LDADVFVNVAAVPGKCRWPSSTTGYLIEAISRRQKENGRIFLEALFVIPHRPAALRVMAFRDYHFRAVSCVSERAVGRGAKSFFAESPFLRDYAAIRTLH